MTNSPVFVKTVILGLALTASTVEAASGEPDLLRYAITQGGLLAVSVVLLLMLQRAWQAVAASEKARLAMEQEKSRALMEMATRSATAMEKNAEAVSSQSRTIDNLTRLVEFAARLQPPSGGVKT